MTLLERSVTVLVTGASGFLGTTILRQLDECAEVREVLALDIRPLPEGFHLFNRPLKFHNTDIRDLDKLKLLFKDVDVVIHTAAVIELGMFPDRKLLQEVNVAGTQNVIRACRSCSVSSLIFTSTSEMGRTFEPVVNFTEEDIDLTDAGAEHDLLNGYAASKREGERKVLSLGKGASAVGAVALRPVGIYGEGDVKFLTTFIRCGKRFMGIMPHLGSKQARIQRVYVGNVAWAHVCAMRALLGPKRSSVSGESFLVTDDTPVNSNFHFVRPFLEANDVKLVDVSLPLWLVFAFWLLLEVFVRLLHPLTSLTLPFTKEELHFACTTAFYDASKISALDYRPKFSPESSFKRSLAYYSQLELS